MSMHDRWFPGDGILIAAYLSHQFKSTPPNSAQAQIWPLGFKLSPHKLPHIANRNTRRYFEINSGGIFCFHLIHQTCTAALSGLPAAWILSTALLRFLTEIRVATGNCAQTVVLSESPPLFILLVSVTVRTVRMISSTIRKYRRGY